MTPFLRTTVLAGLITCVFVGPLLAAEVDQPVNLALGRPYTYTPQPRYPLTADAGDAQQLTDGKRTTGPCMWTDANAVGWNWPGGPVRITVDLGKAVPISGAGFSASGGRAGVTFPFAIYILVSDDGEHFRLVDDLITAAGRHGIVTGTGYQTYVYRALNLAARGRYVRFVVVPSGTYVMCDEVEVFAAKAPPKNYPLGGEVTDIGKMVEQRKLTTIVKGRLAHDLLYIEELPGGVAHPELWRAMHEMPAVRQIAWRSGLPYNDLHRRIWAAHGTWARNKLGVKEPLVMWSNNRWDPLGPFSLPDGKQIDKAAIDLQLMQGEVRSDVVNFTNLTDQRIELALKCLFDTPPAEKVLSVRQVAFVECQSRDIVANALPEAAYKDGLWRIGVPAGATRQAWLMFRPDKTPPGTYQGLLTAASADHNIAKKIPIQLIVHPLRFPAQPALNATAWDYCYPGGYVRHEKAWREAIQQMREHFITSPWMGQSGLPWPRLSKTVDADGNITGPLDWSRVDAWIAAWPDARNFMFYFGEHKLMPETPFTLDSPAGHPVGSWNDFCLTRDTFSIIYWDEHGVTDSKQLEAIREGVEDYEVLTILQQAIKDNPGPHAQAAQRTLDHILATVPPCSSADIAWRGQYDRAAADQWRSMALRELLKLTER